MPELAEVKLTSEFVNKHANKIYVSLEKSPVSKVKTDLNELSTNRFVIKSLSRGKEMIIDFGDMNLPVGGSYQTKRMKITLGMSGAWIYYDPRNPDNEKWHKHTHLRLTDERGNILGLCDVRRFAKWTWGNFDDQRSPCPFIESDEFRDNLLENWCTHKDFKKHTLSEILMSQKWFNGVGNYLRAEILYRLDRNPFMIASELHSEDLKVLIDLTISCVKQAYKLGGGQLKDWKNPDGEDPTHFKEWMKCYGRLEKSTDKTGRTFWHDKKWSF